MYALSHWSHFHIYRNKSGSKMRVRVALAPRIHSPNLGSCFVKLSRKAFPKFVLPETARRRYAPAAESILNHETGQPPNIESNQGIIPLKRLPPPSPEQKVAIDTLPHTDDNLIIDATTGSGKTTTVLHLAQFSPETNFLVLVYNRWFMLKECGAWGCKMSQC